VVEMGVSVARCVPRGRARSGRLAGRRSRLARGHRAREGPARHRRSLAAGAWFRPDVDVTDRIQMMIDGSFVFRWAGPLAERT